MIRSSGSGCPVSAAFATTLPRAKNASSVAVFSVILFICRLSSHLENLAPQPAVTSTVRDLVILIDDVNFSHDLAHHG